MVENFTNDHKNSVKPAAFQVKSEERKIFRAQHISIFYAPESENNMLCYYNQMTAEYPAEADPVRIDYALQNLRGMNSYHCLHLEYRADLHTSK